MFQMGAYYKTFEDFFLENLPHLYEHFVSLHVTPNLYLMEWLVHSNISVHKKHLETKSFNYFRIVGATAHAICRCGWLVSK